MKKGKLVVIEGADGSGKETQTRCLCEALKEEGFEFQQVSFPCYGTTAAGPLEMFLHGDFGMHPDDVGPHAASTFYAVDRFASYRTGWHTFYESGGLVISDRYTTSSAVYQGAKLPESSRHAFLDWLYDFEYRKLGLPEPDLVIYLDVPTEISFKFAATRKGKAGIQHDIHEVDAEYQAKSRLNALDIAAHSGWKVVNCAKDGVLRSIEDIHQEVLQTVRPILKEEKHCA